MSCDLCCLARDGMARCVLSPLPISPPFSLLSCVYSSSPLIFPYLSHSLSGIFGMWTGDSSSRHCECGEAECDGERLWAHFEHAAACVTRLYRESDWKWLQTCAAATTQLYKSGLDCHKRGFDRGFQAGRQALAKELYAMQGQKVDVNVLLELMAKYAGVNEEGTERDSNVVPTNTDNNALSLFQQALIPNPCSSPGRSHDLKEFFSSQVARHRKRTRSPSSPSTLLKRMRRN